MLRQDPSQSSVKGLVSLGRSLLTGSSSTLLQLTRRVQGNRREWNGTEWNTIEYNTIECITLQDKTRQDKAR